jgi:hypothetical protein
MGWDCCVAGAGSIRSSLHSYLILEGVMYNQFARSSEFFQIIFTIWINLLPVFAARMQHGSQICFATFMFGKIRKMPITQQPVKLEKKNKHSLGIVNILEFF